MTKKLYEYNVDESFEICLLIKSADVRMAKNGNPFIAFTFQDQSGQMDGKILVCHFRRYCKIRTRESCSCERKTRNVQLIRHK